MTSLLVANGLPTELVVPVLPLFAAFALEYILDNDVITRWNPGLKKEKKNDKIKANNDNNNDDNYYDDNNNDDNYNDDNDNDLIGNNKNHSDIDNNRNDYKKKRPKRQ